MAIKAQNPILAGFYPDPSICAVGEDFYLVNSTFSYFPGLPIWHSRDLAHWEQIGNVMTRSSQLPLAGAGVSEGLFAPTIRYHNGTFYVICTNVSGGGNFIVTADRPEGPYSEPHYLEGADGIDPSLFFDEDGKCYYIGTHAHENGRYYGDNDLYIRELDLEHFCFVGEVHNVWNGACKDVPWPEGPHLYKVGEYYYILYAEGGTGPDHSVCVVRSKNVFGPYENNPRNPILTHRHLGKKYPVQCVGHADLVQTQNGDWYMTMLATRPIAGRITLGRETFLSRVIWEDDWPVVNAGLGMLSAALAVDFPDAESEQRGVRPNSSRRYDFTELGAFGPELLFLRNPNPEAYQLTPEGLRLCCAADPLTGKGTPTYISVRQDSHCFEATAVLSGDGLYDGACAGLCLFQNENYQLRLFYSGVHVNAVLVKNGVEERLCSKMLAEDRVILILQVIGLKAYLFTVQEKKRVLLVGEVDISDLSTEVAGGFVGCTVGLFAQDIEERKEPSWARFSSFTYERLQPVRVKRNEKGESGNA